MVDGEQGRAIGLLAIMAVPMLIHPGFPAIPAIPTPGAGLIGQAARSDVESDGETAGALHCCLEWVCWCCPRFDAFPGRSVVCIYGPRSFRASAVLICCVSKAALSALHAQQDGGPIDVEAEQDRGGSNGQ